MPTDTQLKLALATMQGDKIYQDDNSKFFWRKGAEVLDTELLYLCWLVEETLTNVDCQAYFSTLRLRFKPNYEPSISDWYIHATWQQRTIALCKVKGIEVI